MAREGELNWSIMALKAAFWMRGARAMPTTYTIVKDLLQVLIVPISLAVFGYCWPLWLARTKRDEFEEMIWREMHEMNPLDHWVKDREFKWWQLLPKRFVHERIFLEPSSNREFVLSLDATLAYHEFQMWTAIQNRII
jgi:hypothetical protein